MKSPYNLVCYLCLSKFLHRDSNASHPLAAARSEFIVCVGARVSACGSNAVGPVILTLHLLEGDKVEDWASLEGAPADNWIE